MNLSIVWAEPIRLGFQDSKIQERIHSSLNLLYIAFIYSSIQLICIECPLRGTGPPNPDFKFPFLFGLGVFQPVYLVVHKIDGNKLQPI